MPIGHTVTDIEALDLADLRPLNAGTRLIRFDRTTEKEFRLQYQETMVPVLRHALILAAILVAMITALDWALMPRAFATRTALLRIGIMLPAIGIVAAMTVVPRLHRYLTASAMALARSDIQRIELLPRRWEGQSRSGRMPRKTARGSTAPVRPRRERWA